MPKAQLHYTPADSLPLEREADAKFEHYRTLPSLREVLLVAQDSPHVVYCVRQDDGTWLLTETRELEAVLDLPALGCELPMAEIYARVEV